MVTWPGALKPLPVLRLTRSDPRVHARERGQPDTHPEMPVLFALGFFSLLPLPQKLEMEQPQGFWASMWLQHKQQQHLLLFPGGSSSSSGIIARARGEEEGNSGSREVFAAGLIHQISLGRQRVWRRRRSGADPAPPTPPSVSPPFSLPAFSCSRLSYKVLCRLFPRGG